MSENFPGSHEETITETVPETKDPQMYRVLLHNDDFTTKDFVVEILMAVFHKTLDAAMQLMWHIHKNGIGVAGVFTLEVAETKIGQVTTLARENGFPLKLTLEEE